MVAACLWRTGWRHLVRHRWLSVLSITGIALGVAVVVGADRAGDQAHVLGVLDQFYQVGPQGGFAAGEGEEYMLLGCIAPFQSPIADHHMLKRKCFIGILGRCQR